MAIQRGDNNKKQEVKKAVFSVGLNVIMTGSKEMTHEQQDALMTVGKVRVLIVAADDPKNVLFDGQADAREFSTGSVGYSVQEKGLSFAK